MTDIKKYLTISAIVLVILYACFAFVPMTFNASNWTEKTRAVFVLLLFYCEIVVNVSILIIES